MKYNLFYADLPFRAQRDYVHSTSLCNFLSDRFPGLTRLELVLKHWMDSRVLFTPVDAVRPGEGTGYVKLQGGGHDGIYEISEDKTHPVSSRDTYDEDALVDVAALDRDAQSLTCLPGAGGSFFDRLIAANKVLINGCLDPGVKLIAAKVVTPGTPPDDPPFTLQLASHAGTRIFKSRLLIDDQPQGEVIFYGQ